MQIDPTATPPLPQQPPRDPAVWTAAQKLETAFLAEMLRPAGLGGASGPFGGGIGEEQFGSFLTTEQAGLLVRAGGVGLSESIYRSLIADHANAR